MTYPLIYRVQNAYPGARIFFLTFRKNQEVFSALNLSPAIEVLTIREDSLGVFVLDLLRVIRRLRRERIDIALDLELFSRFTAILAYLSGAVKRVGFWRYCSEGLYRGDLLTHKVQYNPLLHISKSFISFWDAVKEEDKSSPEFNRKIEDEELVLPQYYPPEEIKKKMQEMLLSAGFSSGSRLVLMNPGEENIPLRVWPLNNFISLAENILLDKHNYLVLVGMQGSLSKANQIQCRLNDARCINLVNATKLEEVLALLTMAHAFISNDCGLAHLAALTRVKEFIIFGPESPQVYAPLSGNTRIFYSGIPCAPCFSAFNHRESACRDNKCLKFIKPEDVYSQLQTVCFRTAG